MGLSPHQCDTQLAIFSTLERGLLVEQSLKEEGEDKITLGQVVFLFLKPRKEVVRKDPDKETLVGVE